MRKILAVAVVSLSLLPAAAFANKGGIPNNPHGHGGAPLPVVGVGLPGLAVIGALYLLRRRREDKGK